MIGFVLLLALAGTGGALAFGSANDAARKAELRARHQKAERRIDGEFSRTKRAMNDAAGQSWRNLVD